MSGTPAVPPVGAVDAEHILAIDFGMKRTGVAVGSRMMRTATSVGTVKAEGEARFSAGRKAPEGMAARRAGDWRALPSPTARRTRTRRGPRSLAASCMVASLCPCSKWMSATAPRRRLPKAQTTAMPPAPASSWSSF